MLSSIVMGDAIHMHFSLIVPGLITELCLGHFTAENWMTKRSIKWKQFKYVLTLFVTVYVDDG